MIEELRIRDLGVISDATLPLGPGFTAITGETGAGKTMVVTALGLLMGERGDAGSVRQGAAAARVGGLIHTTDAEVVQQVEDAGGEVEDGELTLTRTVAAEGRSRASVGGSAAPVGALSRLAERLFAVHGQSEQLRLKSAAAQRDMLDRFGGPPLQAVLADYQATHAERRRVEHAARELDEQRQARQDEAERLRAEVSEIAQVDPQPGEERELRAQLDRLGNLEELRIASVGALEQLSSERDDPYTSDAAGLIDAALRELDRAADLDARLGDAARALRDVRFQLADVARDLAGYVSDLDADGPAELDRANARFAEVTGLFRRYGDDTEAVIRYGDEAAVRLAELDGDDDRAGELHAQLAAVRASEQQLADQLSARRVEAAGRLATLVTAELHHLALPDARLEVQLSTVPLGSNGADEVQLMLQPHPGAPARPLARGASGGELSRVMLALEVVVAESDPVPTFVFDEVDAGVGGAAAIEIGRRLSRLANTSQVIVVTHLAQVAAFANNHLVVRKDSAGGFTASSCRALEGSERRAEMARLLSGLSDSESALEHAAELLELGAAG